MQVCLQKEQENCVRLELRITELEEQVDKQTTDLSAAVAVKEQLEKTLEGERENSQVHICTCMRTWWAY